MGSQRVGHDWATELNWTELSYSWSLKAGEGDYRGWDGWMVSPAQWTWVWINSGSWWWTERPGVQWLMGLQRVGHDWVTELNQILEAWIVWPSRICSTSKTDSQLQIYQLLGTNLSPRPLETSTHLFCPRVQGLRRWTLGHSAYPADHFIPSYFPQIKHLCFLSNIWAPDSTTYLLLIVWNYVCYATNIHICLLNHFWTQPEKSYFEFYIIFQRLYKNWLKLWVFYRDISLK